MQSRPTSPPSVTPPLLPPNNGEATSTVNCTKIQRIQNAKVTAISDSEAIFRRMELKGDSVHQDFLSDSSNEDIAKGSGLGTSN